MRAKKGQQKGAGGAAAFIAIMGLFIVLYVLFLPGNIRDELLNENISGDGTVDTNSSTNSVDYELLLKENPGRLDSLNVLDCEGNECSHEISSFVLYKTTDSAIIDEFNPFIVKNNIMTKKAYSLNFGIDDVDNTDNIKLTFSTPKHEGVLTIKLNGNVLYEKDIDSFNPNPIELPKSYLAKTNNLEFSVSPVSWEFWKTNEYQFDSVRIIGDITDLSRQKSSTVFYISDSEYYNLDRAKLKFSPSCKLNEVGVLDIVLNGRHIYSNIPDCEMLNVVEFPPDNLEKGENTIIFNTDSGNYLMDLVEIRTDLEDIKYPVYYFDIGEESFNSIKDGDANLSVRFEFVGDNEDNFDNADYEGEEQYKIIMTINGHKRNINTYDEIYDRIIPYEDLREENNWIKLEPRGSPVEIAQMVVEVIPND